MTTVHGWAGSPSMRLAVEVPADARAGVVICAPLGQEGVIAYRALRLLADELALRGVASVRYDPHGHGDSAPGAEAGDLVRSALEAADVLRAMGVDRPGFVGLASAGIVASAAAATTGAPLVVWDAPASGKSWLRRQRALASMSIPGERIAEEVESIVGVDLGAAELADLQAMRIVSIPGQPALAAVRPGEPAPGGLGDDADRIEVQGMVELLDGDSISARIPGAAVEAIADWTSAHLTRTDEPLRTPSLETSLALDDGTVELIRSVGPDDLFAIETIPGHADEATPVVLLHNGGAEHRVGANDYQVEMARELARDGVRVLRVDRRGTGESGPVTAEERGYLFTEEWIADQDAVVESLAVPGDRLAVVGMCAGAWLAARAVNHTPRLVVAVSPNDYRLTPAEPGGYQEALSAILAEEVSPLRLRLRRMWVHGVPERIRHVIDARGRRDGVAGLLVPLAKGGTSVAMLMGPEDAALFDELGGARTTDRLPQVDVVRVPDGDHALFSPRMRRVVLTEVRERVAAAFPEAAQSRASVSA